MFNLVNKKPKTLISHQFYQRTGFIIHKKCQKSYFVLTEISVVSVTLSYDQNILTQQLQIPIKCWFVTSN